MSAIIARRSNHPPTRPTIPVVRPRSVALVTALALGIGALVVMLAQTSLGSSVYASGFTSPVAFVQDPLDRSIQFVVEQAGRIRVVRDGTVLATDFLDIRNAVLAGGERGLLGMACMADGRVLVNFTDRSGDTVVARFRRSSDPLVVNAASRFDLRWNGSNGPAVISQPFANHNGGHLLFGPDGFLYIGLGDGGSGNDPEHRAQNPAELLGKMLRIDVNVPDTHPTGYQVPADNPFVSGRPIAARPEIWSFGLRNPWRYSFDDPARGGTGALIIGDVGQNEWEEINYEPPNRAGRNYGWRNREGTHDNVTSRPAALLPLIDPIHEYSRSVGQSVTGGYVYRGRALGSAFSGRYFFADYVQGRVWSAVVNMDSQGEARTASIAEHTQELGGSSQLGSISSFGLDADGELYIVSHTRGTILAVAGSLTAPPIPTNLRVVR
jgi:glucose/arabinose dehydrogenase